MKVKLNKYLFDYLSNNLLNEQNTLISKLNSQQNNNFIFVDVDNNTADEIRDWAIDRQSLKGFDINYELTIEGIMLEELIDTFYYIG